MTTSPEIRPAAGRLALLAIMLLLSGCATLRQFGPSVEVASMTPAEYIALKRGDILTTGRLSASTREAIRVAGLDAGPCAKPSRDCIDAMYASIVLAEEHKRAAMAELWLQHALAMAPTQRRRHQPAGTADDDTTADARLDAWMHAARESYAYLFFTERTASQRAFEDRQTQVRDYYNLAVQEAAIMLFDVYADRPDAAQSGTLEYGHWRFHTDLSGVRLPGGADGVRELVRASSLSFVGALRSVHRRDGLGAELVAVVDDAPVHSARAHNADADAGSGTGTREPGDGSPGRARPRRPTPVWSEMPSPSISVLMRFSGDDLPSVLADNSPEVLVYDPYQAEVAQLHGQRIPLAANFTAGYGLWLARSGFSRQSLRSLFGREGGIDHPHLYLMQPYDPDRRIVLMIHGLASSPEAWVNVANELMSDKEIRSEFQVWQFYYPTNMPIALNHHAMREALESALQHFDPQGTAQASRDMVLVGHSMGGVISRLMVSTAGDTLWDTLLAGRELDDGRRRMLEQRLAPLLRFEPLPQVRRVVFIAAPHRGTEAAGGRLGRWIGRLVRLPLSVLESFADVTRWLAGEAGTGDRQPGMNSIENLDRNDPFVKAAADLPIAPDVPYHSIIARTQARGALADSDDGLVPYWSSHLPGAVSEKVIVSGHSVQETTPAIVELRRILYEDVRSRGGDRDD